jgi:TolB-like protein/Flp pilus assembly protein TadD
MAADEAGTLARLNHLRAEVIEPKIKEFRGKIVGSAGDSLLVEFASVVSAVECAVKMQASLAEQNTAAPEDRRMQFRMGVNLGDIIAKGGTIYGDGVNVAARLEKLAEAGGICISSSVYEQVKGKLAYGFDDLGTQRVHNIPQPIQVYRVLSTASVVCERPIVALSNKPSIAVLPFANLSGDGDQQYFSDGITEDILTELSRFRALSIIARNSSFRFRAGNMDAIRIGRELGAQYLLEGSVRKLGDKIRITAQLIDATTGNHVWAERFDRAQDEIFTVQDQVVRTIVATMAGRLQAARVDQPLRKPPASLAAYDCVLRANALPVSDREAQAEARRLSERAIELDPNYGRAYSQLAISYYWEWAYDWSDSVEGLEKAYALANKAVMLDENDSNAYTNLGLIHMRRRSYDLAEHCCRKAMALNPNSPICTAALGVLYGYLGKTDEAVSYLQQARIIDPFYEPTWYWPRLGVLHFIAGRYDEALIHLNRSPAKPAWVCGYLAACFAMTGQMDEAAHQASEARRLAPNITATRLVAKEPFKQPANRDRLREGLRRAGLPE